MISVRFQGKPFNIAVIQVYAPTSNTEEAEVEWFYDDLQDLLGLTPPKDVLFTIGDRNAKVRKSRNTWSNRQIWPWNTEWSRVKANRVLPRERTGHSKHKRRLYTWTSTDGQYQNQIDYILCSQRWRSSIQTANTRLEADCGLDHELLIAKFRLKLKKVGETTRSFSSVQLPSHVRLFATPWIAAWQASLSITNSQSSPELMCIVQVWPKSNPLHL